MLPPSELAAPSFNGALLQLLQEFRGRELTVLLNTGNRGDGLIHVGGRRLFASAGLQTREVHEKEVTADLGGDVLLVYGAGAFGRGTHTLAKLVPVIAPRFRHVVLLPSSFDLEVPAVRAFARSLNSRYTIFCRELISFDAMRKFGARPHALMLGHDLALHADLSEWAARPHEGKIGIFRCDNEATYGALPRGLELHDASKGSDRDPEGLLDYVARYSVIHTDRCHAAVSGALMRRRVIFYRNNYFKNQAIYDHSLSGLPNVEFIRTQKFSFRQFMRATYWGRLRPIEMKVRSAVFRQRPAKAQA